AAALIYHPAAPLHAALPILPAPPKGQKAAHGPTRAGRLSAASPRRTGDSSTSSTNRARTVRFSSTAVTSYRRLSAVMYSSPTARSEEHTSELQSRENLVCRL